MKNILIPLFLILTFSFNACKTNPSGVRETIELNAFLPPSTGNLTELVLVLPDRLWASNVGSITRKYFQAPLQGLPQKESIFNLIDINSSQFSSIFKSHKNILQLISSDSTYVNINHSGLSKNQLFIRIYYNSEKQLEELLIHQGGEVRNMFLEKNQNRRIHALQKDRDRSLEEEILKGYNFSFLIPKGFEVVIAEKDFLWLRRDLSKLNVIANIWVYSEPYKNENQMTKPNLIALRDSIGKKFIKGGRPGSYMATEMLYNPDLYLLKETPYSLGMKGLWTIENDFLGGGFVSHTVLDQKTNSLVYAEGFLYSPNQKKRQHILELEAVLSTLELQ